GARRRRPAARRVRHQALGRSLRDARAARVPRAPGLLGDRSRRAARGIRHARVGGFLCCDAARRAPGPSRHRDRRRDTVRATLAERRRGCRFCRRWLIPTHVKGETDMLKRLAMLILLLFAVARADALEYTDVYYTTAEPGWGVFLVQSDTTQFLAFFIY